MRVRTRVLLGTMVLLLSCRDTAPAPRARPSTGAPSQPTLQLPTPGDALPLAAEPASPILWLAAGGGSLPGDTQVSIEQDIALVQDVLAGSGVTLFAGGPESLSVQVDEGQIESPPVVQELADLFAPRAGRTARYRRPAIQMHGPATLDEFTGRLRAALAQDGPPLTVFFAGHGLQGAAPADNLIAFWGPGELTAAELADIVASTPGTRPIRLINTACYGGGFASVAFADPVAGTGAVERDLCGFFAVPWDLPAAGCDPNPDRRSQQGFGLHFVQALRGLDRDGNPLAMQVIDVNGDGAISFAEARAYTRHAGDSPNVPTTTSEGYLRAVAPARGPRRPAPLPEQEVVVRILSQRLDVDIARPDALANLVEELGRAEEEAEALADGLAEAQLEESARYRLAAAELLALFPYLDDPWHPLHRASLEQNRAAIEQHIENSDAFAAYHEAVSRSTALDEDLWQLRTAIAPLESLVRAAQTIELAERLAHRGGAEWTRYQRFRSCEASVPQIRPASR